MKKDCHLAEHAAWTVAVICLVVWAAGRASVLGVADFDISRFAALQSAAPRSDRAPDRDLWSAERVRAWRLTLARDAPEPLGVLRIPRIGVEVAILPGTSDWTLDRAVGHIEETALPGTDGNSGIAGHRDGFFRALKDVHPADVIELETRRGRERYAVERVWIVAPDDVWVLDPTPSRSLTLVTCYPFYFIGSAPQRYIVRAVRVAEGA